MLENIQRDSITNNSYRESNNYHDITPTNQTEGMDRSESQRAQGCC